MITIEISDLIFKSTLIIHIMNGQWVPKRLGGKFDPLFFFLGLLWELWLVMNSNSALRAQDLFWKMWIRRLMLASLTFHYILRVLLLVGRFKLFMKYEKLNFLSLSLGWRSRDLTDSSTAPHISNTSECSRTLQLVLDVHNVIFSLLKLLYPGITCRKLSHRRKQYKILLW